MGHVIIASLIGVAVTALVWIAFWSVERTRESERIIEAARTSAADLRRAIDEIRHPRRAGYSTARCICRRWEDDLKRGYVQHLKTTARSNLYEEKEDGITSEKKERA